MESYIKEFVSETESALKNLPNLEIAKALNILEAAYERDGRIYVFGNGGSLALATHWVCDFNKTVFGHTGHELDKHHRRFQAIRLPTTEEELTAWANDVGFDMVFAGPLQNYLQDADAIIAISSSGNSANIVKAVELAKKRKVPVIGLSGFENTNTLNQLSDAKLHVPTKGGNYFVVEGVHGVILHLIIKYFKDYFDHLVSKS
ncbi:MAG: SIS domain-containing protein [Candidatus Liptonbacteria bacterium]|nr:SIS domain-containing protein [Candidatus Liptonbacteria bacterium]